MDVDAVLARTPQVALVDELAHTNVPGSRNDKRWQDIEELLDAGHRRDHHGQHPAPGVAQRRGRADHRRAAAGDRAGRGRPRRRAGRARRHDARGAAPADGARQHLPGREGRRGARQLLPEPATSPRCASWRCSGWPTRSTTGSRRYRAEHDIDEDLGDPGTGRRRAHRRPRGRHADPARRPDRGPDHAAATCWRCTSPVSDGLAGANPANLARQRQLVESLGGTYHQVVGDDVAEALLDFARAANATQLVLGASRRGPAARRCSPGPASGRRPSATSGPIDVHIVTHEHVGSRWPAARGTRGGLTPAPPDRRVRPRPRSCAPLLTLLLAQTAVEPHPAPATSCSSSLVVVAVALIGGFVPALLGAAIGRRRCC